MRVIEAARLSAETARKHKDDRIVGTVSSDQAELTCLPQIEAYRGEIPVAIAMVLDTDLESVLRAAQLMTVGFDADVLCVTNDGYALASAINPETSKRWAEGELQAKYETRDDAIKAGAVVESLRTLAVNRAGDLAIVTQPFSVERVPTPIEEISSWSIDWDELETISTLDEEFELPLEVGPEIADLFKAFMKLPGVSTLTASVGAFLDPEEYGAENVAEATRAHMDCATVKTIAQVGDVNVALLLHAPPGSIREQIIKTSLAGHVLRPDELAKMFEDPNDKKG